MNAISEARLQLVNPSLTAKIHQLASIISLDSQPITLIVSAGVRSWLAQNTLYAQGRTTPGNIVTNAPGGYSWHNYGVAVDCEPEIIDNTIDWNAAHPQWKRMEEVGVSLGMTSGSNWIRLVDAPHFQVTGRFPENEPNDEARQIYQNEGAQAFWGQVDNS
jgi:peptidoglycan LD-endopeptidase CwlK